MILNVRKRQYVRRLAGYAVNPVQRKVRVWRGQDQPYTIGGAPVLLPAGHDLPFYQRRDPTYDAYAGAVLADLARGVDSMLVIDVGANVGDTAVEALTAAPNIDVIAVEGAPDFASYARRNVAQFGPRAKVLEGFVGPVGSRVHFRANASTGGFQGSAEDGTEVEDWITPGSLLSGASSYDEVVWKSDIDGFDIHVLVNHWSEIDSACHTLWFEFDPASTLGDREDVGRLIELLAASGRNLRVFDNLGRQMLTVRGGASAGDTLASLSTWLVEQRAGHMTVPYVDIWAHRPT